MYHFAKTRKHLIQQTLPAMNESIRLPGHVLADIVKVKAHIDQHPLQQKNTDYFSDLTGINRKLLQVKAHTHIT
jgi:hypothetical protein